WLPRASKRETSGRTFKPITVRKGRATSSASRCPLHNLLFCFRRAYQKLSSAEGPSQLLDVRSFKAGVLVRFAAIEAAERKTCSVFLRRASRLRHRAPARTSGSRRQS